MMISKRRGNVWMKYGKPSKLIDVVMNDIKRLKIAHEAQQQKFFHLIDTVEHGYHDLFRMKPDKKMSINTVVSMTEEKLPNDMGRKWEKKLTKLGAVSKTMINFHSF